MKKGQKLKVFKKVNNTKKIILVVGSILIFFFIISFTVNDDRKPTLIEKTLKDGILFINKLIIFQKNTSEELENVKKEYQSEIDNLKKEINILKESLELNTILSSYEIINATTINRNLGYFYDTITLDKGSKEGIEENQAVMTNEGLIGKTTKVTKYTSTVKLLTNPNSKTQVSVQIIVGDEFLYGILTSYNQDNYYIVEGITDTDKIQIGNRVTTTGMGDIFPSGILIGEVIEITKDNFDLEGIIKVKPSVNYDNINYVKILRRGK